MEKENAHRLRSNGTYLINIENDISMISVIPRSSWTSTTFQGWWRSWRGDKVVGNRKEKKTSNRGEEGAAISLGRRRREDGCWLVFEDQHATRARLRVVEWGKRRGGGLLRNVLLFVVIGGREEERGFAWK